MLLIKNGRVMDPKSGLDQVCDVLVEDGKIIKIAPEIKEEGAELIDAIGLVVAPGLVDIHVHFREPGQTHKEDIHTGALAAAAGGFTTVVMMANTNPTISDVETLQEVLQSAAKEKINVKTVATITKNFNGQDLTDFKALLEAGAVGFSDDGIPLESSKVLKEALETAKKLGTFVCLHEEDPGLNGILGFNENIAKDHFKICGATGVAEYAMIARDVMIAYATKAHVHIQHLSKEESVKVVEFAQGLGAHVTAEVAPQHFSKTEALLLTQGSNAKMNPPLRLESDCRAVIEGLKSGVISVIGNALPREFSRMIRLEFKGEYEPARKIHHMFTELYSLLFVDGNPAGCKALLNDMGMIENVLRLPLVPTTITTKQKMADILKELRI